MLPISLTAMLFGIAVYVLVLALLHTVFEITFWLAWVLAIIAGVVAQVGWQGWDE